MERFVLEFVCRSALIAVSAALVLFVLRVRDAATQHAIWTGVLVAMLGLPLWMTWGPKASLPVLPSSDPVVAEIPSELSSVAESVATDAWPHQVPPTDSTGWNWRGAAVGIYFLASGMLLLRLGIGTARAQGLTADMCVAPITVGFFRPRVLLPPASVLWPASQLAAVLAHEGAHVRRRDPLIQWLALLNRAIFWFHPLAWWLERRLAALAEDACDAAVLVEGHDATDYATFLLQLANAVERAGTRVNAIGMAMPGSDLAHRIRRIVGGGAIVRISPIKLAAAAIACAICAATFAAGNLERIRSVSSVPLLMAQVASRPSSQSVPRAKFEVASIRPCRESDITPGGKSGKKGGRGGGGRVRSSADSIVAECQTVENLVRWAYLGYPDGKAWPIDKSLGLPIRPPNRVFRQEIKGPGWINSDRYTVEAKAERPASMEMMRGPMMQTLLEDRLHLKVRIEYREVPVYILTRGAGEPTLQPTKEGSCISFFEFDQRYGGEPPKPGQPMPRVCGGFHPTIFDRNPNIDRMVADRPIGLETYGQTMAGLCQQFSGPVDRDVIDRTGLTGMYDIHLDLASQDLFPSAPRTEDSEPPPSPEEKASHIAAAVRKLGLKFEPGKASAPFLMIERVERPSEN